MFDKLSHVMLFVTDLDRAMTWYQQVLGFSVRFAHPPHYASLVHAPTGTRLDLHPTEAAARDVGFGPMPYFATRDMEAALKALAAKGVKVGKAKSEGGSPKFATFWDSEGNALGLEEAAR